MSPPKKAGKKPNKSTFSMDQSTMSARYDMGQLRNSSNRANVMTMGDMKNTLRSSLLDQNMKTYTAGNGVNSMKDDVSPTNIDVGQPFGKPRPQSSINPDMRQISPKKTAPSTAKGTGYKTPLVTDGSQFSKRSQSNLNQTIN